MRRLLALLVLLAVLLPSVHPSAVVHAQAVPPPQPIDTKAAQAYLIEASTGTVLLAKNERQSFAPASLAKLMTLEVVFDALKKGEIRSDTVYPVSEYAWRTGGAPSRTSTMFAAVKSQVPVADLIKGIAVQTANDGCLVIAEGMAGSEADFVERMNARAAELGLAASRFGNATGLPHPDNRSTLYDLVKLSQHIVDTYPELYRTFGLPEFEWNKILQRNRNPLLSFGADGLGTGFAEGSGFAILASMERGGRRLFLGLSGVATDKERTEEAVRLLNWGFDGFEMRRLFAAGEVIGEASVYGGAQSKVPLVAERPVEVYVPINNPERLQARIVYRWPLDPPVAADREIATLNILAGERPLMSVPLMSDEAVEVGTLRQRAWDALIELLFFWI
ncbi:D-alanyl-D-alanine carboxypeptidase (penicillin-binding protein 5/6) [Peteryoungia aggregata LMG 23059]|uniref:serine-type D-Ala-D-Ala carboxypeptidase n=1 Tax=Peteryoungia aggregata LMG 23059 TaxID=1368425 RepID=A0ABU0GCK9_9HYPH|nr:D-alanyl-D-alanine carboxypeptidase family protein [Peteryoungia aggregata]MDQ0423079.1 D-alanyl-D-alanine carboxypeptidase (penicillin-binding protein 5/6) [Peteryoungia aggregata LMG 23059]